MKNKKALLLWITFLKGVSSVDMCRPFDGL